MVNSGNAGAQYSDSRKPADASARYVALTADLGRFRFLKPDMPAPLKERLWLLELGVARDVKKLESGLSPENRDLLRSAIASLRPAEFAQVEQLSQAGSLADKLAAADTAADIASRFASSSEGRRCKEILATRAKDDELKNELGAKRLSEAATKVTDPARRSAGPSTARLPGEQVGFAVRLTIAAATRRRLSAAGFRAPARARETPRARPGT